MFTSLDAPLAAAARAVRLLASVTPVNGPGERLRLAAELRAGGPTAPRWRYEPGDTREGRERLASARAALSRLRTLHGDAAPAPFAVLAPLYERRLEEIDLELSLVEAVDRPSFPTLARRRFAPTVPLVAARASAVAQRFRELPAPVEGRTIRADGLGEGSLLSCMRAEVGRRRLPFRVVAHPSLGPLAATGEDVIYVATGRLVDEEDVRRTVLHEVEGHACPRVRARQLSPGLFAIGTAGGADAQEGLALLLEERGGFLVGRRARELGARHGAVEWMADGADFAEVARRLARDHDFSVEDAVAVAGRAFRGGAGRTAGLGRERVYLEAFAATRAHLDAKPADEDVLRSGQVALDAIDALRDHARAR